MQPRFRRAALAGGLFCLLASMHAAAQPARVRFDEARLEVVSQQRAVTGELRPAALSRVAAEEEGLIVELAVELGDSVEVGTVLARLDDTLLRVDLAVTAAQEAAALATINERKAEHRRAEREVERLQTALESDGAAPRELEDAEIELDAAAARLERAKAELARSAAERQRLEARLEDMTVRAPLAGQVVADPVEVGEWISPGETVVEIVRLDAVDLFVDIPQDYVGAIDSAGGQVAIEIAAAKKRYEAKRLTIVGLGDPLARSFPARVRLTNADGRLRPGMSATATVPTGRTEESLTVHKDAIMRGETGAYVFIDQGGVAGVAPVEVRFAAGDRLVVRSPRLEAGTRVVIEGNERMYPTQPLIDVDGPQGEGG